MKDIKVSVIVPVYNAEKTLERCLDSLVNQTLNEVEIITVNDMSTDGSWEKIKKYEQNYPNKVKSINLTEKGHAGGARNKGIESAQGEYIGFVDADDFVDVTMYEKLYNKAKEEEFDMVEAAYYDVKNNTASMTIDDVDCGLNNEEKICNMMLRGGYIVTKIFKREYINGYNIRFRENVKLEDTDFLMYAFIYAKSVSNIKEILYVYDNTSTEDTWSVRKLEIQEYKHIKELMKEIKRIHKQFAYCRNVLEAILIKLYAIAAQCCTSKTNIDKKELMMLKELRDIKCSVVEFGYDNIYLPSQISEGNIELVKYMDKTFKNFKC